MSHSALLVKEIFVHNSWNVEQGISHPKERVFTVGRQKHIVLCKLPLTNSAQKEDTNNLLWYRKSSVSDFVELNEWIYDEGRLCYLISSVQSTRVQHKLQNHRTIANVWDHN